jgi:replication factor C large subunit
VPQALKGPADVHEFSLSKASRRAKLKEVAKAEGVPLDEHDLEQLAERPDLRSAINDLQLHAEMGVPVDTDQRDLDGSEFEAMDQIIQEEDASDVDVRPPWLVLWLDQNVRKQLRGFEAAAAFDALARADRHLGAAGQGDYRGWRYAGVLAEQVANLRLADPYTGWVRWAFPEWAQASEPDPTEETDEAMLYRELKGYGEPGFSLGDSYTEFLHETLPILRRLPAAERKEFVVDRGLPEEAAAALDVSSAAYAAAMVEAEATAGEALDPPPGNALEGEW